MIRLPNQDVMQIALESIAQPRQRIEIDVSRLSRINTVNQIFGNSGAFRQAAGRQSLAGSHLLFTQ
jgi:hypothetical protein